MQYAATLDLKIKEANKNNTEAWYILVVARCNASTNFNRSCRQFLKRTSKMKNGTTKTISFFSISRLFDQLTKPKLKKIECLQSSQLE